MNRQHQLPAVIYFALSTVLTWWFVAVSPLYISKQQMILSTGIAGGKWALQIIIAILLLKAKKWELIKNIASVCFAGSVVLVPYIVSAKMYWAAGADFFIGSLIAAVLLMIWLYNKAIIKTGVSLKYWYFWLLCLAVAISLQLTVVFHVF